MAITKADLDRILNNNLDDDAKTSFLSMTREDQLTVILAMEASNSNRLAIVEKWQIEFQRNNNAYRMEREMREKQSGEDSEDDLISITQKAIKIYEAMKAKEFNFWLWFRDKVLPSIATIMIMIILYLVFQQWSP